MYLPVGPGDGSVSGSRGECLPLGLGVSASGSRGGVCLWIWGMCLPVFLGGVGRPPFATPPSPHPTSPHPRLPHHLSYTSPVNRMTDRCKNITLPQTSFTGGKHQVRARGNVHGNTLEIPSLIRLR